MILGLGLIVLGYAVFYWGATHFCHCMGISWGDNECQRTSLLCLLGLQQGVAKLSAQTNEPIVPMPA